MRDQSKWAEEIARKLLEQPLPRRWAHTQGVARQARALAPILGADVDLLEAAAWLHDIGYAPDLIDTGLHALDGARYLGDLLPVDDMLCRLVANHTNASSEATELGLANQLSREFPPPQRDLADALTYCDMTTSPSGKPMSVWDRISDIVTRYGPDHVVSRSIGRSTPEIVEAIRRVEHRRRARSKPPEATTAR